MLHQTTQSSLGATLRKLALPIAVVAITAAATNAFGSAALIPIPPLPGPGDTSNLGLAIVPDGKWVSGTSNPSGHGFLYDVVGGNVYDVHAGPQAMGSEGVCYRTSGGQQEIIVAGYASGWVASFMTTNNGSPFQYPQRDWDYANCIVNGQPSRGSCGEGPSTCIANALASGGGDVFWLGWYDNHDSRYYWPAVSQKSGVWAGGSTTSVIETGPQQGTSKYAVYGVSGTGRAVGFSQSVRVVRVWDWTGTGSLQEWSFNTLTGTDRGEAFAVSANGQSIFGRSPTFGGGGNLYGFKATFDTTMPGPATQLSVNPLPLYPDTGGSSTLATVYGCSPDGNYAVGEDTRSSESAALWDTSSPDPMKWTVLDLYQWAVAQGIAGSFTSLSRAFSVATNSAGDLAITGWGTVAGVQTAFVMNIPRPLSAYSVSPPTLTIANNSPGYTFSFRSIADSYLVMSNYLEYTTVISNAALGLPSTWTIVTQTPCNGLLQTLTEPTPADPQRFYRLRTQ